MEINLRMNCFTIKSKNNLQSILLVDTYRDFSFNERLDVMMHCSFLNWSVICLAKSMSCGRLRVFALLFILPSYWQILCCLILSCHIPNKIYTKSCILKDFTEMEVTKQQSAQSTVLKPKGLLPLSMVDCLTPSKTRSGSRQAALDIKDSIVQCYMS